MIVPIIKLPLSEQHRGINDLLYSILLALRGETPTAPSNLTVPVVSGTAEVDQTLISTTGTWGGNPESYAFQWQADGADITGATGSSYTILIGDTGKVLTCVVTAINDIGYSSAESAGTAPVTNVPINTVIPAITGTAQEGQLLTCSTGTWSNTPTGYAYQWLLDGVEIVAATSNTYTPVTGDVGGVLTCEVTASNAVGDSDPALSNPTATIIPA